jgi:hypothetical protein
MEKINVAKLHIKIFIMYLHVLTKIQPLNFI